MGCKQQRACENNKFFNFFRDSSQFHKLDQCKPNLQKNNSSVCRQCCDHKLDDPDTPDDSCALNFMELANIDRGLWNSDQTKKDLPPNHPGSSGKDRRNMFKLVNQLRTDNKFNDATDWIDPNDSRYVNDEASAKAMPRLLTDFVKDLNDGRYNKPDIISPDLEGIKNGDRHLDDDYQNKLGW